MMVEVGEWHYNRVLEGGLDDGFTDSSGCGVDAQGLVEGLLGGFGAGGFSHMQGAPVGPAEGGCADCATPECVARTPCIASALSRE